MELSRQVFPSIVRTLLFQDTDDTVLQIYNQYGQAGYAWSPDMQKTPGPFQSCVPTS